MTNLEHLIGFWVDREEYFGDLLTDNCFVAIVFMA